MTKTRAGVSAIGTALALGALLILAPGLASAQDYPPGNPPSNPPSDAPGNPPTSQPPAQPCNAPNAGEDCREPGRTGAGNDAPPLNANPRSGGPGTRVNLSAAEGFEPLATVTCNLVRTTTAATPDDLGVGKVDDAGAFSVVGVIPDVPNGVYVLYCEAFAEGTDDPLVSTLSFIVRTTGAPAAAGAARTGGSTGSKAAPETIADLPDSWSAPAGWSASPAVKSAVTEAINFRLAALKTELPDVAAAPADAAAGTTSTSDDLTLWYAGGAALALLAAAAVGLRRRSITTGRSGEVQA